MTISPPTAAARPARFASLPLLPCGAARRVGVEIEFMGLDAWAAAQALQAAFGGSLTCEDPHAFAVDTGNLGRLVVELDLRHVHPGRHDPGLPVRLPGRAAALLGSLLLPWVPRELVLPPLRASALTHADRAVAALRAAGAEGAGSRRGIPLGLHFNVEPPDLKAATLLRYLRAYLRLEPWLRRAILSGKRHRLAAPFPAGYARLVLDRGYRPDLAGLIGDYLRWNPTRDRGLDLLPIFLHLAPEPVRARLPRAKIGRRPVLHHRLPLAHVGVPGWGIAADWNRWVAVERLAQAGDAALSAPFSLPMAGRG